MAEQYITNIIEIVTGVSSLRRKDGNPYEGEDHGALRHYKGVKSYDLIVHGDFEEALLAYVTDWNQLVLVAREAKLTEVASQCVAEGCDYHYESRNGRIIVRAIYKEKLERRFLGMDWSYEEPDADDEDDEDYDGDEEPDANEESDGNEADDANDETASAVAETVDILTSKPEKVLSPAKKAQAAAISAALARAEAENQAAAAAAHVKESTPKVVPAKKSVQAPAKNPAPAPAPARKVASFGDLSDFD